MSKIGNYRTDLQESEDYRFGWESAARGEPRPFWRPMTSDQVQRLEAQRCGWGDYQTSERSL